MKSKVIQRTITAVLLSICLLGSMALIGCGGDDASAGKVTITVDITLGVEANDPTAVALAGQKGGNIYKVEANFKDGDNVLTATQGSTLEVAVATSGDYITTIDGLAATATGGWVFTVNGESPVVGADQIPVEDGDEIIWIYVADWTTYSF